MSDISSAARGALPLFAADGERIGEYRRDTGSARIGAMVLTSRRGSTSMIESAASPGTLQCAVCGAITYVPTGRMVSWCPYCGRAVTGVVPGRIDLEAAEAAPRVRGGDL